ncbi:hypothetical protein POM88_012660 [Heracleum sosnowskyi]|uniref:Spt6 SH2 domain-containing protein n=1 Tax=Heracleum sosnowskyi TaxID=360622 RepID=A0AAD8N1X3_9APIA|nr:hypothetical protein POM88_012660 [Heracleum sosnowskyi]
MFAHQVSIKAKRGRKFRMVSIEPAWSTFFLLFAIHRESCTVNIKVASPVVCCLHFSLQLVRQNIGNWREDTFEDLDEVMDRYVDPLVANLKKMLSYRKFKNGSKAEVDQSLRSEKAVNPAIIVYCFGISHEYPGSLILSYIRNTNPHHEYVGMYPKGFKFRKRMFEDIDRLVVYFQRHIDDPRNLAPSIKDPGV